MKKITYILRGFAAAALALLGALSFGICLTIWWPLCALGVLIGGLAFFLCRELHQDMERERPSIVRRPASCGSVDMGPSRRRERWLIAVIALGLALALGLGAMALLDHASSLGPIPPTYPPDRS